MIKAILFDYFGVVASSEYWDKVIDLETQRGRSEHFYTLAESMNDGRMTWRGFCEEVAKDLGVNPDEVERHYETHNLNRKLVEMITNLKAAYTVCLASNAHHEHLEPILASTGLDVLFDRIYLSSHIGSSKPHASFFEHILSDLKLEPVECLFIDDAATNVDGAEQVGIHGIIYENLESLTMALEREL